MCYCYCFAFNELLRNMTFCVHKWKKKTVLKKLCKNFEYSRFQRHSMLKKHSRKISSSISYVYERGRAQLGNSIDGPSKSWMVNIALMWNLSVWRFECRCGGGVVGDDGVCLLASQAEQNQFNLIQCMAYLDEDEEEKEMYRNQFDEWSKCRQFIWMNAEWTIFNLQAKPEWSIIPIYLSMWQKFEEKPTSNDQRVWSTFFLRILSFFCSLGCAEIREIYMRNWDTTPAAPCNEINFGRIYTGWRRPEHKYN